MAMYIRPYRRTRNLTRRSDRPQNRVENEVHVPLDVKVKDDVYTLELIVPGLSPEDVEIEIVENTVKVEGEFPGVDDEAQYLRQERPSGIFRRMVRLPKLLDVDASEAKLEDGILKLSVPVAEEARPRTIQVKAQ